MIDFSIIKVGDKVHYQPSYFDESYWENGIVKEIPTHCANAVRVVFHCGEDWDNFKDYTSALTPICDLKINWKYKPEDYVQTS